ncbi:HTH-type transcriptional regulator EutR [Acerihabitans sp. TG2]|uniref:HTH-type transcriptional regulator EutR n=1 Tax=Acerihabitans sp. TG2 TaxID=3096008 RepID=UPI002B22B59F|nr:HTH-type transcriptional regulator EutR [Acerihabitans sp. TG2]MEA9389935.1 HTH-type transcriptional regulator EutR [Acerihabitans sp. TG2]
MLLREEDENIHHYFTQDVYAQSCAITAWQQLYDQIHPGHFQGELTEILFDGIQLCREYTSLALRQSCMVKPESFWLGIPATPGAVGFIGSQPIEENCLAVSAGGEEFELNTPDEYAILGMVISHDTLFQDTDMLVDQEQIFRLLSQQSALIVEPHKKAALCALVHQVLWYGCADPQRIQRGNAGKALNHHLLMALLTLLESAHPLPSQTPGRRMGYRRLVNGAREYVLDRTSEPVTVLDLCRELYVSRRTLQTAFCDVVGVGPNSWLKMIRLNAVHRELISPFSRCHNVTDAAMSWGFWHLSQFATDYQLLFNEKPSATLRLRHQPTHGGRRTTLMLNSSLALDSMVVR